MAKSDKEHKLIFIDVATSWCGFCKKMKLNVFNDKEVAEYFNNNFINLEIDAEKGEGKTIAHQYGVTSFPTLIIADKNQQPVYTTEGYIDKDDFLKMAKNALALSKK